MSPSAKRAARSKLRKTAHANTKTLKATGEGVPNLTLTEAQWQTRVIGLARFYGWRIYHPPDNVPTLRLPAAERLLKDNPTMSGRKLVEVLKRSQRRQDVEPGYPDLTMVRVDPVSYATTGYTPGNEPGVPELIIAELKTETGRLGPGQDEWAEALSAVASGVGYNSGHALSDPVEVEYHLWRPSMEDEVHDRLARGRARVEPSWFVGTL